MQTMGWEKKYRSRKWRATKAVLVLEFVVVIAGTVGMFLGKATTPLIIGGFSAIGATFGLYFTVDTLQKHQRAVHYRAELDTDVRTDGL